MSGTLIFTAVIAIAISFYMRHNARRYRAENIDSVKKYHDNYMNRRTRYNNLYGKNDAYRKYVTKYNSTEDYRERQGQ